MDRINTSTKAVDLFGAGKHGFKDGDLALGVVPTDLDAEWCNSLQEELLAVIEGASLVPSGASLTQLKQAVQILAGINDKSIAANGWVRLPSGVILQWGNFTGQNIGNTVTVVFPIAFPTACYSFVAMGAAAAGVQSAVWRNSSTTFNTTQIGVVADNLNTNHWFAVGS